MKALRWMVLLALICAVLSAAAQKDDKKDPAKQATVASKPATQDQGEKLFQTHCGRCHAAPEELSPRVARTAVQHMRVRAMLSEKDAQEILEYIAP